MRGKKKVGFLFKTTLHAQNVKEEINYPVLKINGSVVIELIPQELRTARQYSCVTWLTEHTLPNS